MSLVRRGRFIALVPAALVLAAGYLYTAFVLGFGVSIARNDKIVDLRWYIVVGSIAFCIWHVAGYLGYVSDGPRKVGYLFSAAWLAGFTTLLWVEDAELSAGYVGLACAIAVVSYWKYPRRNEG